MSDDEERNKLIWIVAGTLIGSVSLNQGINKTFSNVRSDPYTGTQGVHLHEQVTDIEHRVNDIDKEQWRMISRMVAVEVSANKCTDMVQLHLRVPHP